MAVKLMYFFVGIDGN